MCKSRFLFTIFGDVYRGVFLAFIYLKFEVWFTTFLTTTDYFSKTKPPFICKILSVPHKISVCFESKSRSARLRFSSENVCKHEGKKILKFSKSGSPFSQVSPTTFPKRNPPSFAKSFQFRIKSACVLNQHVGQPDFEKMVR